jgi:hypothetical protein
MHKAAIILSILLLTAAAQSAGAITIATTGSTAWSVTTNQSNLIGGAGTDLTPSYQSATTQYYLTIAGTTKNQAWRVDISAAGASWPSGLTVSLMRTGSGSGGSVAGGTAYVAAGATPTAFFTGTGNVSFIPVRARLSGVTVAIPTGTYTTTVTFRVTTTP